MTNGSSDENWRSSDRVWSISRGRLAALLRALRIEYGRTQEEVDRELAAALEDPGLDRVSSDALRLGVHRLESTKSLDSLAVTLRTLRDIAKSYGIERLILDPLLSQPKSSFCVTATFGAAQSDHPAPRDDFETIDEEVGSDSSADSFYRIPRFSLAGTDEVALVHVQIPEGRETIKHWHTGAEIVYVLKGSVEIRLTDRGTWNRVDAGGYAHYYADQYHLARNVGKGPAELFVIRFYQVGIAGKNGSREAFVDQLERLYADIGTPRSTKRASHVLARVINEVKPATEMPSADEPTEVVDRFGLAQLLRLISNRMRNNEPASLQQLAERAHTLGLDAFNRSRIDRLHNGLAAVKRSELEDLARLYEVEPFLFVNFLYPTFRSMVTIRENEGDFVRVKDFVRGRAEYLVPKRRLADSDVAIVLVKLLESGDETPMNRHPGHELIIPLEGEIAVVFNDITLPIGPAKKSYAHYHATVDHATKNIGSGEARFMVVRFHED